MVDETEFDIMDADHESRLNDKVGFCYKDDCNSQLEFEDGLLWFSSYSYEISSWGSDELSKEETRKLYEAMKVYYDD